MPNPYYTRFQDWLSGRKLLFSTPEEGQRGPGEVPTPERTETAVSPPAVPDILRRTAPALAQVAPTAASMQRPEPADEPTPPALREAAPALWNAIGKMPWTTQVEKPSAIPGGKPEVVPETRAIDIQQGPGGVRGVGVTEAKPDMANPAGGTAAWMPALAGAAPTAWALKTGLYPGAPPGTYNTATGTFTSRAEEERQIDAQMGRERPAREAAERRKALRRQGIGEMMTQATALIERGTTMQERLLGFSMLRQIDAAQRGQVVPWGSDVLSPGGDLIYENVRAGRTAGGREAVGEFGSEHEKAVARGEAQGLKGDALASYVSAYMAEYRRQMALGAGAGNIEAKYGAKARELKGEWEGSRRRAPKRLN